MRTEEIDVAVIGGGPAGLAAAISAKDSGANSVVVLDRNNWLGGILPQCIHDGFGVEETGESMTGPEYAERYISMAEKKGITFMRETMVLSFDKNRVITAVNHDEVYRIKAKAVVLAMGCREKTRWSAGIPGDRPSGVFTAGVAQAFINLYNIMPGRNVVVLGSGDVGLIMARRLKLEGANVLGVVEILPYASGLLRNIVQCLEDYDIPLYLNHTVINIEGRGRLKSVTIAQVDHDMNIIPESEKKIPCDTLLLSLGLIPENELTKNAGIEIDDRTGGPIVDQCFETTAPGVFACGNCLQVYDTVDVLAMGAKNTGKHAGKYVFAQGSKEKKREFLPVKPGDGIRYILPQRITKAGLIDFTFRVDKPYQTAVFSLSAIPTQDDTRQEIYKKTLRWATPATMERVTIDISDETLKSMGYLEGSING